MLPELKSLIDLQQVDLRLQQHAQDLDAFPAELTAVDERILKIRRTQEERKTRLVEDLKDRKKFEVEIASLQEKIRKYKDQQFEVKTNEAYRALLHEIEAAEKAVARFEDGLLEKMVEAEVLEKEIKAAEANDKQAIADLEREKLRLEAERETRAKELESLRAHREELRRELTTELLQLYDHLAKLRKGAALAEARDGICQGCLVRILPQSYNLARTNEQIVQCDSCSRILYSVETVMEAGAERLEA